MLAYPLLVYGGLRVVEPRALAVLLGGALLLREVTLVRRGVPSPLLLPAALVSAVLAVAVVVNDSRLLLFVPVVIHATLLVSFGRTLLTGMPMVERLARRRLPSLTPADVAYCRRVTGVWCGLFLVNGAVTLTLALRAPVEVWALYTGLIAYLLVGAVWAAELTYRAWRFRRYDGDLTDPLLQRLFPPPPAP